jgi:hypothetical protein
MRQQREVYPVTIRWVEPFNQVACEQPTHLLVHLVPVWYAVVRLGGVKKRGRIGAHYTASVSSFPSQP